MVICDNEIKYLISDYNHWNARTANWAALQKTRGMRPFPIKATAANVKVFEDMRTWCAKGHVEPRFYLYCLFFTKGFFKAPKREPAGIMVKSTLEHAKIMAIPEEFKERMRVTSHAKISDLPEFQGVA